MVYLDGIITRVKVVCHVCFLRVSLMFVSVVYTRFPGTSEGIHVDNEGCVVCRLVADKGARHEAICQSYLHNHEWTTHIQMSRSSTGYVLQKVSSLVPMSTRFI